MRSQHSAERLEAELTSRIGPSLSHRGYRVVASGRGGVTWRRDWSGKVIAGMVVLGLLALGGVASGDAGSFVFGVACGIGAGTLFYLRRPADVAVTLLPVDGGMEIAVLGGPDVGRAQQILQTLVAPSPTGPGARFPDGDGGELLSR